MPRRKDKTELDGDESVECNYPKVSYIGLFRYSDVKERICVISSIIISIVSGVLMPMGVLILRDVIDLFVAPDFDADKVYPYMVWYFVLGVSLFITTFTQSALLGTASKSQIRRIRLLYFKSILRQDVTWFDSQSTGALLGKLSQNIDNIHLGIDSRIAEFFQNMTAFFSGLIMAAVIGWKLTLVASCMLPVIGCTFTAYGILMKVFTVKELAAYLRAGTIASESLSAIRTVLAFGGETKECKRYVKELDSAKKLGIYKSITTGSVVGTIGLSIFSSAALIFWYGIQLMMDEGYEAGSVLLIFLNVLMGSIYIGNAMPHLQFFLGAAVSAREVFGVIERIPPIDKDCCGDKVDNFNGNVEFQDVTFSYPTRSNIEVLKCFNLSIRSGQTVALVGPSGSGKSTIIHLLQRFYDPIKGQVLIEGKDIRTLHLKDFRSQIGVVQQEPILFEGTVADNIRFGKPSATHSEIEDAARQANAHDFIIKLPEAYSTMIGGGGGKMSGGQKQRIAIARALIRKPKLLLLDEATSALDTRSERVVQVALDKASVERTVVVVAHRLTTVRKADRILVLDKGVIRETGTHDELVAKNGLYTAMLRNQKASDDASGDEEEGEEISDDKEKVFRDAHCVWRLNVSDDGDNESETQYTTDGSSHRWSRISQAVTLKIRKIKRHTFFRIMRMSKPEVGYIIGGCIFCLIAGACEPAFALLCSEIYEIFTLISQPAEMDRRISFVCGMMALVGFIRFFSVLSQQTLLGIAGERLIKRVRSLYFEAILRQDMAWFDQPENQTGELTVKLATEASKLKAAGGSQLGTILEAIMLASVTIIIAFVNSWQLTLLFLAFFPFIVFSGILQVRGMNNKNTNIEDIKSMCIAQEAIANGRTVFTLTLEDHVYNRFVNILDDDRRAGVKRSLQLAALYAVTQSVGMFSFSAVYSLAAYLLGSGTVPMINLFRTFSVMNLGSASLGRTVTFLPDAQVALVSTSRIFQTLDRQSRIPVKFGLYPEKPFSGKITFNRLYFRYPTRRETRILKNFTHTVEPKQTVALVGQSGCGKSTLLQLLQRFYDPSNHGADSGIFFDEHNLRDLAPEWIRQQIGIVSQEPTLFDLSIYENIAYGDNSRDSMPMEEIIEAARQANIHDTIVTLPEQYQTKVGERGVALSGGQKQRIAIARALLRKPKLLLLDEATSALDNESERVVQEALDAAVDSRSSLVVAHRLTTVEDADLIVVVENGRKIESGPPKDLMNAKGAFYALHNAEALT